MSRILVPVTIVLLAACNPSGTPVHGDAPADLAGEIGGDVPSDAPEELPPPTPDSVPDPGGESTPDGVVPGCEAGEGCFLDPCAEHADCLSGWCVEHMGNEVCTKPCQDDCPPGWSCRQVGADGPDVQFLCISDMASLCRPCGLNADCKSVGGVDGLCLSYGPEGSFCGGLCGGDGDCPWGFSCAEAHTVEGVAVSQCVADAGVCPCTATSVALSLATPCVVENRFGACPGLRVCTPEGLSGCDASEPVAELCNGLDDDCDGAVDEPLEQGGDYVNLCADGNPCTQDTCQGAGGCDHLALGGGECVDGNPCTAGDHCEGGTCLGLPVICDDGDPCTDETCDGLGGCVATDNSAWCDDGNPCTVADRCDAGNCIGVAIPCECANDADCAALEDGNACNGTLVCDTGSFLKTCVVDPSTVSSCPEPPPGEDAICLQATCDPGDGTCGFAPDHEGQACDDGDPCTIGDHCAEGACAAGPPLACSDGNLCTDDSCGPGGCVFTPNAAPCSDGNPCTTGDHCAGGWCGGGGLLACTDGNPCTTDSCVPATGCKFVLNQDPCNDGDLCTVNDHCHLGSCIAGGALSCNDGNPCTDDSCAAAAGCVFTPNAVPCDDGSVCTGGDHCAAGACKGGALLPCDDSNPCTDDYCDVLTGCLSVPNKDTCNDLNACTANEFCHEEACGGGVPIVCTDGNPCTDDTCLPATGCQFPKNTAPCSDSDACTGGDACAGGACVPGPAVTCNDGNPCTADSCAAATGCVFTPVADETPCGAGFWCQSGACEAICSVQHGSLTLSHTGAMQSFTVPACVESLVIEAWGAQGGMGNAGAGGRGARMKGTVAVTPGQQLKVLVGGQPSSATSSGGHVGNSTGGGGGSFVATQANVPLLVAGGGGGGGAVTGGLDAGTETVGQKGLGPGGASGGTGGGGGGADGGMNSGRGGGGFTGDGGIPPADAGVSGGGAKSFVNGGAGGPYGPHCGAGGFGGGGQGGNYGGGGGGYSGGGGGSSNGYGGGGGGSWNGGTAQDNAPGVRTGHGQVTITW